MGIRLRDHYDCVVLGDHPGALLGACLAARLGLSVLHLPFGKSRQLAISNSGVYLDPEPNSLIGLERTESVNGLLIECLTRIGLSPSEIALIQNQTDTTQIITPSVRFLLAFETDLLDSELSREFGKDLSRKLGIVPVLKDSSSGLLRYWLQLPDRLTLASGKVTLSPFSKNSLGIGHPLFRKTSDRSSLFYSRKLKFEKLLEQLVGTSSEDLAEFFEGILYSALLQPTCDASPFDFLQALAFTRTQGSVKGGLSSYRSLLLRLSRRLGVHMPDQHECRRLFIEEGKFVGIQVTHQGKMISVGGGILGDSLSYAAEQASFSGKSWFRKLKKPPVAVGWRFTVSVVVRAEAIPPGMTRRAIWQEQGAPSLEIEIVDPSDFGAKPAEDRLLFIRTLLPFQSHTLTPAFQRLTAARMFRKVTEILPFVEFYVSKVYPDFRAHPDSPDFFSLYGFKSLEEIPENLRVYGGKGVGSRSGIEGLFVVSGESFPRLGSLGGTAAAVESVAWLAHHSGLMGPLC